jgi:hypothetical protein
MLLLICWLMLLLVTSWLLCCMRHIANMMVLLLS